MLRALNDAKSAFSAFTFRRVRIYSQGLGSLHRTLLAYACQRLS